MPFHTEIPKRDRERTQKRLASNDTNLLFVAHCELLSEGFDHPLFSISVVLHSVMRSAQPDVWLPIRAEPLAGHPARGALPYFLRL